MEERGGRTEETKHWLAWHIYRKPLSINVVLMGHRNVMYTQMFKNSHTQSNMTFVFVFLYTQQHLCYILQMFTPLSLVYCDMRYMRGKFLFTPQLFRQHGNILLKILQHCIHSATFNDCLKQQAIRAWKGGLKTHSAEWY